MLAWLLAVQGVKLAANDVLSHDHVEVRRAVLFFQIEDDMIDQVCVPTENGFPQCLCALLQFEKERDLPVSPHLMLQQLDRQLSLAALYGLLRDVAVGDVWRETKPRAHLPCSFRLFTCGSLHLIIKGNSITGGYLVDCPMCKNPAFSFCWGELQKLGDLECKGKQTSLNQPEEFYVGICGNKNMDGWVLVKGGEMNLSRSTGVVSLLSWGRVRGSPIL